MNLDQALQTYIVESRELLDEMENALLAIEQADEKAELINAIFRAAHTIKGSSGLFDLDHVVKFTHVAESVLDRARAGELEIADGLVTLLLSCCDHIRALIDAIAEGQTEGDPALAEQGAPLLAQLQNHLGKTRPSSAPTAPAGRSNTAQRAGQVGNGSEHWHISVRFGRDTLRNGMDPLAFIRFLGTLGRITDLLVVSDHLPEPEHMDPEVCYLGYEIAFDSQAKQATIENAFEFVRDDCELRILPPHSRIGDYIEILVHEAPETSKRISEMLMRSGALTRKELEQALDHQTWIAPAAPIEAQPLKPGQPEPSAVPVQKPKPRPPKPAREARTQESRSIRIDADKLDELINLVGELIIVGAGVNLITRHTDNAELRERTSKLSGLVEEVRDSALQLRMVKIGATFSRFQRVVHDVARDLGKDIALHIEGEDTELDKTVVEKIGDPLLHLVRNSMDHGIEPVELRLARGKPAQGLLKLNAFHDSGSIVITVEDDGGGLNRDRILAKGIERGLVNAEQTLSDSEIYGLIFEPGFSTADTITNLSGRGVGLDVVKRNISALRGNIDISSEAGRGTTVTVRLPLTLAIINGFLVEVDASVYAIPLDMIEECVAFSAEPGHDYTNLRGQVLPFIRLRELFGIKKPCKRRENIVVLKHAGQKAGLVVDTLLGEFQTVIKPLSKLFKQLKCISGSTILGSGEVALILDVPALIEQAVQGTVTARTQATQTADTLTP